MNAWRIEYDVQHYEDAFRCVAYLESADNPTSLERLRCILEAQAIDDELPMSHYDDLSWIYEHNGYRLEIIQCDHVPTQRLIRVWCETDKVYVGDYHHRLESFYAPDGRIIDVTLSLANLLANLGFVVSMHNEHGFREWVD
jgi:hypothetical protein